MRIGLGCEPTPDEPQAATAEAVGCLFGLLTGSAEHVAQAATVRMIQNESPDFSVVVPLPVCEACRPTLDAPTALRQALRHISEYAELLDKYPNALVQRVA